MSSLAALRRDDRQRGCRGDINPVADRGQPSLRTTNKIPPAANRRPRGSRPWATVPLHNEQAPRPPAANGLPTPLPARLPTGLPTVGNHADHVAHEVADRAITQGNNPRYSPNKDPA